jgi:hypothetical protein
LTEPAFDQLLLRLSEAGVEFVLVGGLAVNAWGVVQGTKDVEIVVAPDSENLKRLAEVAVEAHGHIQKGKAFLSTPFSIWRSPAVSGSRSRPRSVFWMSSRGSTAYRHMRSYVSPPSTPKSSASKLPFAQLTR